MAAGSGSRYGKLKQFDALGPRNEFLMEFSIYDAIQSGFNPIVLITKKENKDLTWPYWPHKLRTSSSQEEGAIRDWSVMTESFETLDGKVKGLNCIKLDASLKPIKNSNFFIKADLVLLAMGFIHPKHDGLVSQSRLKKDNRGNLLANSNNYMTSEKAIFAAGDARRGQSLVVWAIREGREAAAAIQDYLFS